jgi:hypothetical protein
MNLAGDLKCDGSHKCTVYCGLGKQRRIGMQLVQVFNYGKRLGHDVDPTIDFVTERRYEPVGVNRAILRS